MKKYWVNYEFHLLAIQEDEPAPIKMNRRYDHREAEWTEVNKDTFDKLFEQYWKETENA